MRGDIGQYLERPLINRKRKARRFVYFNFPFYIRENCTLMNTWSEYECGSGESNKHFSWAAGEADYQITIWKEWRC